VRGISRRHPLSYRVVIGTNPPVASLQPHIRYQMIGRLRTMYTRFRPVGWVEFLAAGIGGIPTSAPNSDGRPLPPPVDTRRGCTRSPWERGRFTFRPRRRPCASLPWSLTWAVFCRTSAAEACRALRRQLGGQRRGARARREGAKWGLTGKGGVFYIWRTSLLSASAAGRGAGPSGSAPAFFSGRVGNPGGAS
jgi:hypothetical protein